MNEAPSRSGLRWFGHLAVTLLCLAVLSPLLRCGGECFARLQNAGDESAILGVADQRLNSWILAWDLRAIREGNPRLFDAPAFYPALGTLTGSEHMLGVALPLLPLTPWRDDAVFLHQAATVLSFVVLGNGTFALLWWTTGSAWASALAALLAMFLPWRFAELAHVQILSIQWLPFVLLGLLRGLTGTLSRRGAALLFAVTTLQLLSSFYLAYFVTAVLALVALAGLVRRVADRAGLARAAAAIGASYAMFIAFALPYLGRRMENDLHTATLLPDHLTFAHLLETYLSPALTSLDWKTAADLHYQVPLPALLLAAAALLLPLREGPDRAKAASRVLVVALPLASALALMLGLGTDAGTVAGPHLVANLLRDFLPGYANLRGYVRWLLVLSWTAPVLAGLGVAAVTERAAAKGPVAVAAARVASALLVLLSIPLLRLEVDSAWKGLDALGPALDRLARDPGGVVLHAPWKDRPRDNVDAESLALLAQTRHGHPMLNGETAYPPASYAVLHQIGDLLPDPSALGRLRNLAGLGWILVDRGRVESDAEWQEWAKLAGDPGVAVEYRDDASLLLRLEDPVAVGDVARRRWTRPDPSVTVTGCSRSSIEGAEAEGSLSVVDRGACRRHDAKRWTARVILDVQNFGQRNWPGVDARSEGLVHVRYRYDEAAGSPGMAGIVPLLDDVPAGPARRILVQLPCPARPATPGAPGLASVNLDLVQMLGGQARPLGARPARAGLAWSEN